jgi:hypothetical protein
VKKRDISWILLALGIVTYFIIGGWSEVKKDTDSFSIKIICKKCGSENCTINGYGDYYDSGLWMKCKDCGEFEEASNNGD